MPDISLVELSQAISKQGFEARLEGEDRRISGVNTIEDAGEGDLTFLSNPKYTNKLEETSASAVVAAEGVATPAGMPVIRCADPYAGMTVAIIVVHGYRQHPQWGISERAEVHPTAEVGEGCHVAAGATIAANARIGKNCVIYPGCYVADRVRMGDGCILYPNVVVYDDCVLGDRVTIHSGSVVGQDGLGYAPVGGQWIKIPQVGRAVLGDDVEIGANCAIDRATLGETVVARGTKFGNEVVIGHGTKVGPDCMFVGQVGLAGSVKVGRHVTMAGQVGVAGHISIGDDVSVGAQSGIHASVAAGETILGAPAMPIDRARRTYAGLPRLPDLFKRVRALESELKALQQAMAERDGDST